SYSAARGVAATFLIGVNPVAATPRAAEYEQARTRVLSREELLVFWKAMEKRNDAVGAFWRLVTLTGQRAVQMLAAEDDNAKKLLTLIDTKGRGARQKIQRLPITRRMRAALDAGALQA